MIKVGICDDEVTIVNQMEQIIEKVAIEHGIKVTISVFLSGDSLLHKMDEGEFLDILYLDIEMNGLNGIDTAKQIREKDDNLLLIYVSGYDKYLMQLFRLDVFDFIPKPVKESSLSDNFIAACQKVHTRQVYFSYQQKNTIKRILLNDIMWFESDARQVKIYAKNGVDVFNYKLNTIEERLSDSEIPFIRIHQSYLVNYNMILEKNKTKVIMWNGQELPISSDRRNIVASIYNRLLGGEICV